MGSVRMRDADEDSLAAGSDDGGSGSEAVGACSSDTGAYASSSEGTPASSAEADVGVVDAAAARSRNGVGYRVINQDSLKRLQRAAIEETAAIWGCTHAVAKTLLMSYRWDKERLLSDWGDKGEEHVFRVAGLVASDGGAPTAAPAAASAGPVSCGVCMCDVAPAECSANSCGHAYCDECWRGHLRVQIGEGKARHVVCMAHKCNIVCDEELVGKVMKAEREVFAKYNHSHMQSYLEDNARVTFCPSAPWCGNAVQVDSDPYVEVECACGLAFCFKCGKAPHSPCTCKMWDMWQEKIAGDSETRNWLTANTKPCPKCSKPVEKNGGCNHVVCNCGQAFCWLCGQGTGMQHTWSSIANHSCGRFKDEMDARMGEAARNHKRYMFYFERYKLHGDSILREKANRSKLLERIADSEVTGVEARDFSWLVSALDQLRTARRVLCNSYAFAYFFFGGALFAEDFSEEQNRTNQQLFEDNQEMLAAEVERLSGLADGAAKQLSLDAELRLNVINSAANIGTRIGNLFSLIENDLYARISSCAAQIAVPR